MKMNLSFRIRENGCNNAEVEIEAETPGEQAILHLLADSDKAIISRGVNNPHQSHRMTKVLYLRPEKNFELEPTRGHDLKEPKISCDFVCQSVIKED